MGNKIKQGKNLVYNSQHSFTNFKNIGKPKEWSYDSLYKQLSEFRNKFNRLKNDNTERDERNDLKKVLDDVRDLFNELYYIYRDKYKKKKII